MPELSYDDTRRAYREVRRRDEAAAERVKGLLLELERLREEKAGRRPPMKSDGQTMTRGPGAGTMDTEDVDVGGEA